MNGSIAMDKLALAFSSIGGLVVCISIIAAILGWQIQRLARVEKRLDQIENNSDG